MPCLPRSCVSVLCFSIDLYHLESVGILHSLCVSEVHEFFSNPFVQGKTGRASGGREVANDIDTVPHNSEGCGFTLVPRADERCLRLHVIYCYRVQVNNQVCPT
jgi:hypothetical protein